MPMKKVPNDTQCTMYFERLRTLQDAYVFFMLLDHEWNSWAAAIFCTSRPHVSKHFSSRVPRGSYEQHPEGIRTYVSSRLHIGFDPINLYFTCFACYCIM